MNEATPSYRILDTHSNNGTFSDLVKLSYAFLTGYRVLKLHLYNSVAEA